MGQMVEIIDLGSQRVLEVRLPDSLDPLEFDQLNTQLLDAIVAGKSIVLDLSQTRYVGSSVLGLLVNARMRARSVGASLVLCGLSRRLSEIFAVTSLTRLFTVVDSRQDALQSV